MNGKQKRVRRPELIDGMDADEFILRNADPIWLHQNEMWEYINPEYFEPTSVTTSANLPAQLELPLLLSEEDDEGEIDWTDDHIRSVISQSGEDD